MFGVSFFKKKTMYPRLLLFFLRGSFLALLLPLQLLHHLAFLTLSVALVRNLKAGNKAARPLQVGLGKHPWSPIVIREGLHPDDSGEDQLVVDPS